MTQLPAARRMSDRNIERPSFAVVVPPDVLVHVSLQVLGGDGVMRTRDAALHERPEPFDGVRVDVPAHVDVGTVIDRVVVKPLEAAVRRGVVRVDGRIGSLVSPILPDHGTFSADGQAFKGLSARWFQAKTRRSTARSTVQDLHVTRLDVLRVRC